MTFSPTRSGTERILLWLALIVIIIYGVRMTSPVITILLVSLVLSLLLYPATAWLQKKGLSVRVSVGVVIVAALLCIVLVLFLTISSFEVILVDLPQVPRRPDTQARRHRHITFSTRHQSRLSGFPEFQPGRQHPDHVLFIDEYRGRFYGPFFYCGYHLFHAA